MDNGQISACGGAESDIERASILRWRRQRLSMKMASKEMAAKNQNGVKGWRKTAIGWRNGYHGHRGINLAARIAARGASGVSERHRGARNRIAAAEIAAYVNGRHRCAIAAAAAAATPWRRAYRDIIGGVWRLRRVMLAAYSLALSSASVWRLLRHGLCAAGISGVIAAA